jgi:hypothetical protein
MIMSDAPKNSLSDSTVALLHSEILRTGDDIRALGAKLDSFQSETHSTIAAFIQVQNATNLRQASDIASLKARDDSQQSQLDELKTIKTQKTANRLTLWAVIMGAIGSIGVLIQAVISYFHL